MHNRRALPVLQDTPTKAELAADARAGSPRRKREVRARTISVKRMTRRELEIGRLLYPDEIASRPATRAHCSDGPRPCPHVSCKYHLYADVSPMTGAIKLNFPDLEVWELGESCALDVADRGGTTLEDVGAIMNLTRERIRQVEANALAKLEALRDMMALQTYVDEGPVGKQRLPDFSKYGSSEFRDDDHEVTDGADFGDSQYKDAQEAPSTHSLPK